MKPNVDQPKAAQSKPGSTSGAKDELQSLPMPQLLAHLGASSEGLSQTEAEKRLIQYGPK